MTNDKDQGNVNDPDDGETFEWELDEAWGYGWASATAPEPALREAAAEAVRSGETGVIRWRRDDPEDLHWQSAGEDGPVVHARILTPAQVAEFGAQRRRDYQPPDHPGPHHMPAPESFSEQYFTSAIFAGAVPSFMDLENGIHAVKLFMIGLMDEPQPGSDAPRFIDADHFAQHCSQLIDVLEVATVEYRQAAGRTKGVQG